MAVEPENEFKPPKRKRKRSGGCALPLLLILLLLLGGAGGVSYFYPHLVPASISGMIPWIDQTQTLTPTSIPTQPPTDTPTSEPTPTFTLDAPPPTASPTYTLTPTFLPTDGPSPTPSITLTPTPTPIGGGYGQVAFASERTGVPQIYLINAVDGSDLHPITNLPEGACQPSWSPDGSRLVFTSPCKLNTDSYRESSLYIINADGTELTPLNTAPGGDFDPTWSPDGSRIVFTSLRDGRKEIYSLALGNSILTRLTFSDTDEESSQPAWSPFGSQIAYVKKRFDALQIWTMTDAGQNQEQVVRSGQTLWDYNPVWSPDAQYILFNQRRINTGALPWMMQIRYDDRETQAASRLSLGVVGIENLHYSSDGFWIVYEGIDELGNKDIYYMTGSGATRTRLTTDPDDDFDPAWRPISKP
jgi:Tol biopolymer transport system component